MGMNFDDMKRLQQNFKQVQKEHEKFIRNFLLEQGMKALAQAKRLTPVDTGNLRNKWELSSVFRRGDELYVVIFNPTEYASFVEEGHMQRARWVPGKWVGNTFEYIPGHDEGMMLTNKWIPGAHMARISINNVARKLPAEYHRALREFMKGLGVGE